MPCHQESSVYNREGNHVFACVCLGSRSRVFFVRGLRANRSRSLSLLVPSLVLGVSVILPKIKHSGLHASNKKRRFQLKTVLTHQLSLLFTPIIIHHLTSSKILPVAKCSSLTIDNFFFFLFSTSLNWQLKKFHQLFRLCLSLG